MTVPYRKYAMLLVATILVLTAILLLQPIAYVSAQPNSGDYIVVESVSVRILSRITPTGTRTVIYDYSVSGPPGVFPDAVAIDSAGNYIVTDTFAGISKITPSGAKTLIINTPFAGPNGVAVDSSGNYIVTEVGLNKLTRITPGGARTVIYDFTLSPPPNHQPFGVAIDPSGNYIVAEFFAQAISKITPGGTRTVIYDYAASGPSGAQPISIAIVPAQPRPVGGVVVSVNKLEVLAPYLALAGLVAFVSTIVLVKKSRRA